MGVKPVELVGSILYKLGLSVIPATTFVMVLGIIELLIGLMLFFGLFTRIVAWVATGLLLMFVLGVGVVIGDGLGGAAMMFKDLGLIGGTLCLALQRRTMFSLDGFFREV